MWVSAGKGKYSVLSTINKGTYLKKGFLNLVLTDT